MKIVWFSLLCIVFTNFCMEIEKFGEKEGWKKINTWEDTKQFVGCMVAFNTSSFYGFMGKDYPISPDKSIQYGYINWFYKKKCIDMIRFVKKDAKTRNCFLNNEEIKKYPLFMRSATFEELKKIEAAISSGQAQLECNSKAEALFLMNKVKERKEKK